MADKKISEFSNLSTISDNDVCLVNSNNATFKTTFGTIKNFIKASIPTGVKGSAESTYRTGNVNLTPANIGALPQSGGAATGDIARKVSDVDASKADNAVSVTKYPTSFNILDKDNRVLSRIEAVINTNGIIGSYWYVRNYDTSGEQIGQKGIRMNMSKAGEITYGVDTPEKFRDAIAINDAYNFTTIRKLTNSTYDCNDYHGDNASGIYYVGAGVVNSPQDYCGMLVISRESNTGYCAQIAIGNGGIYYRIYSGPADNMQWTSWYKVTGTAIS